MSSSTLQVIKTITLEVMLSLRDECNTVSILISEESAMSEFGQLIRDWRKSRGFSQMELGLQANISSKHISFLETGRAEPSREMIVKLSMSLDIPLSERNVLMTAAGFTEAYTRRDIEQPEMQPVRDALNILLSNHEPYPAVVFDWNWNILMANRSQQYLSQTLVSLQPNFPQTGNILEMLCDPNGFKPFIENWHQIIPVILQRLHKEKIFFQDRRSELIERLMQYPEVADCWRMLDTRQTAQPMVDVCIKVGDLRLKLFSTLASFGTAIDVTMQELTIEQYFPSDKVTKDFFQNLKLD
jgi:transcriptional regulator with XRE-family HTH domain